MKAKNSGIVGIAVGAVLCISGVARAEYTDPGIRFEGNWAAWIEKLNQAEIARNNANIAIQKRMEDAAKTLQKKAEDDLKNATASQDYARAKMTELTNQASTLQKQASDLEASASAQELKDAVAQETIKYKALPFYQRWFTSRPKLSEMEKIAENAADNKSKADGLNSKASDYLSDVTRFSQQMTQNTNALNAAKTDVLQAEQKRIAAERDLTPPEEIVKIQAQRLFENQEKLYYDSRLLLTDAKQLKMGVSELRNAMGDRLNNTLLGMHINSQIQKLAENMCAVQNKCAAGNAGEVQSMVQKILGAPPTAPTKGDAPQASDRKNPDYPMVDVQYGDAARHKYPSGAEDSRD